MSYPFLTDEIKSYIDPNQTPLFGAIAGDKKTFFTTSILYY